MLLLVKNSIILFVFGERGFLSPHGWGYLKTSGNNRYSTSHVLGIRSVRGGVGLGEGNYGG